MIGTSKTDIIRIVGLGSSKIRSFFFNKFNRSTGGLYFTKCKFASKRSNNSTGRLNTGVANEWELIFKNRNVKRYSICVKFSLKRAAYQLAQA
jgi:hypothetical protein